MQREKYLELKYCNTISRQIVSEGIRSSVALRLYRPVYFRLLFSASAELRGIAVENQTILFFLRHAYPVIRAGHGRKVDDKEQIVLAILRMTHKS